MHTPTVSIILPIFNAAAYLKYSIDSILNQTFTDFELIIINDGSTDNSDAIVTNYADQRIIYIKKDNNNGLVAALNKGIEIAKGKYIGRMDADDIAFPQRLEKQVVYMDEHPEIGVLATAIHFIDEQNQIIGTWPADVGTNTPEKIKDYLIRDNCISHPTIIARAEIMKRFKYRPEQVKIEDYDLWLRLVNRGILISKIAEPLLLYRIHPESVTKADNRKTNVFFKLARCKRKFVMKELNQGRFSLFAGKVFLYSVLDVLMGIGKNLKNKFAVLYY